MSLSMREDKASKPKYNVSKMARLEARISHEQKSLFQRAADLAGRSLTDFIISTLQEAAIHVVQDHEVMRLTLQDRKTFVQSLLNPPVPNKALKQAAKRYQKEVVAR